MGHCPTRRKLSVNAVYVVRGAGRLGGHSLYGFYLSVCISITRNKYVPVLMNPTLFLDTLLCVPGDRDTNMHRIWILFCRCVQSGGEASVGAEHGGLFIDASRIY